MTRSASSLRPVSMTIGIADSSRSLRASDMPSSAWSLRSSTSRSTTSCASTDCIAAPSATVVTRNPFCPR